MPETGCEINGGENGRIGPADVADTFVNLLHGVLVGVGLLIESPEVLHDAQASPPFLGTQKMESCRRIWFFEPHQAEATLAMIVPQRFGDQF